MLFLSKIATFPQIGAKIPVAFLLSSDTEDRFDVVFSPIVGVIE